jgi:hypothetical protein
MKHSSGTLGVGIFYRGRLAVIGVAEFQGVDPDPEFERLETRQDSDNSERFLKQTSLRRSSVSELL